MLFFSFISNTVLGQGSTNYSDQLLSSSFKTFQGADFELAYHMLPFIRKRFINELKDTSSFRNPYDSLSKYIGIKFSDDSLVKTYCWSERSGSCCHTSATFAQYRTPQGIIKYIDLEKAEEGDAEVFITDVHQIIINQKTHYLLLNWGTCCGGKHYETANIYHVKDDSLQLADSVFGDENTLVIGANRSQEIALTYSPKTHVLSYNSYVFNANVGFYTREKTKVVWHLKEDGFARID